MFWYLGTSEAQNQMNSGLLLDVVVRCRAIILELLPREDQALLVWRDPGGFLNPPLHGINAVAGVHLQVDVLALKRLHNNVHFISGNFLGSSVRAEFMFVPNRKYK